MRNLRKATTALRSTVPGRRAAAGKAAPSRRAIAVETPDGTLTYLLATRQEQPSPRGAAPDDRREAPSPAPSPFEGAMTVETPDGIEVVPAGTAGPPPSSPRRRAPSPGGAAVDSRDDDGGCPPPALRGPGPDGGRALTRHRTFLESLEDELASYAAALVGGAEPAGGGGVASPRGPPATAPGGRALVSILRVSAEAGPTRKGDGALCSSSSAGSEPGGGGKKVTVKSPNAEGRGSLHPGSTGSNRTSEEGSFVFDPNISCEATGDPIDAIFDAAALLCGNGTDDSTGDPKPKEESKAREVDPEQAPGGKGDSAEEHREMDPDRGCADHDKATPEE